MCVGRAADYRCFCLAKKMGKKKPPFLEASHIGERSEEKREDKEKDNLCGVSQRMPVWSGDTEVAAPGISKVWWNHKPVGIIEEFCQA